jgi:pimeloyl-ACP methyl ester carboxylesterase
VCGQHRKAAGVSQKPSQKPARGTYAERDDGRRVAFEVSGAPDGFPVVLMHGTPGSRKGPRPRGIVLHRHGVRLITYDRPGYGDSDRREGRDVADAARDVEAIVETLGVQRFAVVGRSGGGPHALACAADPSLRSRMSKVAVLVSFAPSDAADFEWFAGMNDDNARAFGPAEVDAAAVESDIAERAATAAREPRNLMRQLMGQMTTEDRQIVNTFALRRTIVENYRHAVANGPWGWIDDALALRRDWKLELATIDTALTRVLIWHGANDTFAPVTHAYWLADQIPGAEIHVQPDAAHFDAMEALPRILPWLTDGDRGAPASAYIDGSPGQ